MPYDELLKWYEYLERRPIGWREDDRAVKYIQTQGFKGKPWELFPALHAIYNRKIKEGNLKDFKDSFMFNKIKSAKGGVKLDD